MAYPVTMLSTFLPTKSATPKTMVTSFARENDSDAPNACVQSWGMFEGTFGTAEAPHSDSAGVGVEQVGTAAAWEGVRRRD